MTDPNRSTTAPAPAGADLEQRAAEVRRLRAQWEAEHAALDIALSVKCTKHDAAQQTPCYPPPAAGVCGPRIASARSLVRQRARQQQRREARR